MSGIVNVGTRGAFAFALLLLYTAFIRGSFNSFNSHLPRTYRRHLSLVP